MTNLEFIQTCNKKQLAEFLCGIMDDIDYDVKQDLGIELDSCKYCMAYKYCYRGHNGFLNWLSQEREEEKRNGT